MTRSWPAKVDKAEFQDDLSSASYFIETKLEKKSQNQLTQHRSKFLAQYSDRLRQLPAVWHRCLVALSRPHSNDTMNLSHRRVQFVEACEILPTRCLHVKPN